MVQSAVNCFRSAAPRVRPNRRAPRQRVHLLGAVHRHAVLKLAHTDSLVRSATAAWGSWCNRASSLMCIAPPRSSRTCSGLTHPGPEPARRRPSDSTTIRRSRSAAPKAASDPITARLDQYCTTPRSWACCASPWTAPTKPLQFARWTDAGVYFVTRMKDNAVYAVVDERDVPVHRNIHSDAIILLTGPQAQQVSASASAHRRVGRGARAGDRAAHQSPRATTVAGIQGAGRSLFFKALKQNLRVKSFVGTTENARAPALSAPAQVAAPPLDSGVVALQS